MSYLDFSHVPAAEFQKLLALPLDKCPSAVIGNTWSRISFALGFPPSYADSIVLDKTDDGLRAIQFRVTWHIVTALWYLRGRITSIYPQISVGSWTCALPHALAWRIPDTTSKLLIEMNVDLGNWWEASIDIDLLRQYLVVHQTRVEDWLLYFKRFEQSMKNF